MKILTTVDEMRLACADAQRRGSELGFVPTMGALHDGHLSLVRAAHDRCETVAASIFVNPTQFGPNEDFARYPRTLERDCELLQAEKVNLLFTPARQEMYPESAVTFVVVEELSERLCGRSRPGHFRGVTTIVNKLFNIVQPQFAFFGQKDAAQCAIIRRMVRDLDMAVKIVVGPIIRESDGLAMSSRNVYLNPQERNQARVLYRALQKVQNTHDQGERSVPKLIASAQQVFASEPDVKLEYVEIVDPETLSPIANFTNPALIAVAAKVGTTRLIDNIVLS